MKSIIRRGRLITLFVSSSLVLTLPVLAKDFLREVCIGFVTLDTPTPPKTVETLALSMRKPDKK
jgi:hypothetical protein